MNTPRRRCHSEQVPLHVKRVIPPHKAAILREAQLRKTQHHLLTQPEQNKALLVESVHKDGKEVVTQCRHSSAQVHSGQLGHHTSAGLRDLPTLLSFCPKHSTQGSKQERITRQFPSIDTVIAKPKDRDDRRKLGETDFYEYTGDDGIVRRRSMMRTVDKDDFLVARGANPRTGLITPDWNSVASSLDDDHAHAARRDRPSAQWKLDGDGWVSVQPEDNLLSGSTKTNTVLNEDELQKLQKSPGETSRNVSGMHSTTALTEQNLRTFSDQILPESTPHHDLASQDKNARGSAIRRKPVANTGWSSSSKGAQVRAARNVSGDTVICSPDTSKDLMLQHSSSFPYFSPESIGKGLSRSDASNFPQRARHGMPFLGPPVESRDITLLPPRGFTSKPTSRNQLQRSLRTSSGPYPSHLSSRPPLSIKASQSLHTFRDQDAQYKQQIDSSRGRRGTHRLVQQACLPDAMTPSSLTYLRSQLRDYPESGLQTRKTKPHYGAKPSIILEEDRLSQHLSNDLQKQQIASAAHVNTHISGFDTQGGLVNDTLSQKHDPILLSHDTSSHQDRMLVDSVKNIQKTKIHHNLAPIHHLGRMNEDSASGRRPPLGSRGHEMLRIPKIRAGGTNTVLKVRSNSIGTKMACAGEGDEDDVSEKPTGDLEIASKEMNNVTENACRAVHFSGHSNVEQTGPTGSKGQDHGASSDHSVCCPECCTDFDCHDSCIGHPDPDAGVVDGETSSLVSMGILDANFETSVKAVNVALLTPADKSEGRLAKIRTALGWRSGASSPTRSPPRPSLTKRTLRDESLSRKVNTGLIRHPQPAPQDARDTKTTEARLAAVQAQSMADSSPKVSAATGRAENGITRKEQTKRKSTENKNDKIHAPQEANKGRRVSEKIRTIGKNEALGPTKPAFDGSDTTFVQPEAHEAMPFKDDCTGHRRPDDQEPETMNMLDRVNAFVRGSSCLSRPKGIKLSVLADPVLLSHLRSFVVVFKDMAVTIADTTSVIVEMVFEYNRSGMVVLPRGTNAGEVAGNMLRSVLYLMIIACVYALSVKAGRVVLGVLRVVLLPVRICAWIIG